MKIPLLMFKKILGKRKVIFFFLVVLMALPSLSVLQAQAKVSKKTDVEAIDQSFQDLENLIRESIQSSKKRRSHAAKQDEELRLLLAQALYVLKKKYVNYPVEKKFDTKIQKFFSKQVGNSIKHTTRDSIIQLYTIHYIQNFDFKDSEELDRITDRMFSPLPTQGAKRVPVVVERLNKIPSSDKKGSVKIVAEELDKMLWDTWALQVTTALSKYQVTVK